MSYRSVRTRLLLITIVGSVLASTTGLSQFSLQQAFPLLSFTKPVDLQNAGDGTDRIFVVEQRGVISVFENDASISVKTTFLDIRDRVDDSGSEQGLLGLAFHPDYASNGYFYVNYTASGPDRTVISRFEVTGNPNVADPTSELVLLEFAQPYENHNGGQLAFDPDGYLHVATGDGGSAGDPSCNGQNLEAFLGKILRIDVDNPAGGKNYGIPPDNPFAGNSEGYLEEIFAYGLRNPWRFSFDPVTNWQWCGDVGQSSWEEIDIITPGGNYGWSIMEGNHCYVSGWPCSPPCDSTGLIPPVWEYSHSLGFAVTGGHVYRGPSVPELTGKYIYADYLTNRVWSLQYDGINPPVNTQLLVAGANIVSFGVDEQLELYICAFDGKIYSFVPTVSQLCTDITQFVARCIGAGTKTIQARVRATGGWSGTTVTIDIDGTPHVVTAQTKPDNSASQWKLQVAGVSPGTHTVTVVDPAGCLTPLVVDCGADQLVGEEWDGDPSWGESDVVAPTVTKLLGQPNISLAGNYPNPFNPSTTIRYVLAEETSVSVKVFNMLGQEVATLVNGVQRSGDQSVVWHGTNNFGQAVSSGLYIYRVQAGNLILTDKMLLLH